MRDQGKRSSDAADERTIRSMLGHCLEGTSYRLERILGTGAMGAAFYALDEELKRPLVVKAILPHHAPNGHVRGRLVREARIIARLKHIGLTQIYGLGTTPSGLTYIAMEYHDGCTLRHKQKLTPVFSEAVAIDIAAQILDALQVAHDAGVVHRDIKPENIFLTKSDQVKVLDFGIAKVIDHEVTSTRTQEGVVLGTPRYIAPEQALGEELSPATDVYAVGVILFELLTGTTLFAGNDTKDLMLKHVYVEAPSLQSRTGRSFDTDLEAIVAKALAKQPNERFASAKEMAFALRVVAAYATTEEAEKLDRPVKSKPDRPLLLQAPSNKTEQLTSVVDDPGMPAESPKEPFRQTRRHFMVIAPVAAIFILAALVAVVFSGEKSPARSSSFAQPTRNEINSTREVQIQTLYSSVPSVVLSVSSRIPSVAPETVIDVMSAGVGTNHRATQPSNKAPSSKPKSNAQVHGTSVIAEERE